MSTRGRIYLLRHKVLPRARGPAERAAVVALIDRLEHAARLEDALPKVADPESKAAIVEVIEYLKETP